MATYYICLRRDMRAGPVSEPWLAEGRPGHDTLKKLDINELSNKCRGKDILLATHGFNVTGQEGINALGWLDQRLAIRSNEFYCGVLWPGDWWIPAINYSFEAADVVKAGQHLAKLCNTQFVQARSLSFLSHSLGGRLILETVKWLKPVPGRDRPARIVCLTAAAVDNDCLRRQYATVPGQCVSFINLASSKDKVLKIAYPAGDFWSDIFGDNDSPWTGALGLRGPKGTTPINVRPNQIPDRLGYGHGNYLPPSSNTTPPIPAQQPSWVDASDFMIRAFREEPQIWPPN